MAAAVPRHGADRRDVLADALGPADDADVADRRSWPIRSTGCGRSAGTARPPAAAPTSRSTCASVAAPPTTAMASTCPRGRPHTTEPSRSEPETMEAFAEAFAPHGFSPAAFYPCYGLAEATLMVSGGDKDAGPTSLDVDTEALEQGALRAAQARALGPPDQLRGPAAWGTGRDRRSRDARAASGGHDRRDLDLRTQRRPRLLGAGGRDRPACSGHVWPTATRARSCEVGTSGSSTGASSTSPGGSRRCWCWTGAPCIPTDVEAVAEESSPALRHNCAAAFLIETGGRPASRPGGGGPRG